MVGIMSISGLAFGMTLQLVALSGDNVFLLLLLIAVLAFLLGIGLPTVSVYILTATLLAPALIKLGVTPMAAHMFVMYNGILSMITPPVAFAAYAAANIARTDGWTTGWVACLVGWSTFLLPVPVRADAEPADGRLGRRDRPQPGARAVRHLPRHRRRGRLRAGPAVAASPRALRGCCHSPWCCRRRPSPVRSGSMWWASHLPAPYSAPPMSGAAPRCQNAGRLERRRRDLRIRRPPPQFAGGSPRDQAAIALPVSSSDLRSLRAHGQPPPPRAGSPPPGTMPATNGAPVTS